MASADAVLNSSIEIIKDSLYMAFHEENSPPSRNSSNYVLFLNDKSLVFTSFFADFGPLDLGLTHKFCSQLHDTIRSAKDKGKPVVYSCSNHPHHRSNGGVLICAYLIFVHNCSAERAYAPFMGITPPFITFRDAGFCINTFPLTVLDCARAMRRACSLNHFNYKSFNPTAFHQLAKLQNGDLSWIVPGKFLAFSGPIAKRRQLSPGVYSLTPEGYVPILKKLDVSCIVRFNSKCYDRNIFLVNGIRHVDLYYEDGGNPTEEILQAFLQLCENERGAIAVHCKAGLGRTGTNIAAYMMKHYGYTAKETMAWCRLCRPGSIVGPQQQYLESIEARMFKEGAEYRLKHRLPNPAAAVASTSADEKSVISASGSVDGQLSTYTGISLTGPGSISGLSISGGASAGNGLSNSYSNDRVSTPPLLGAHSYANRPKQATESLFRSAVSGRRNSGDVTFSETPPAQNGGGGGYGGSSEQWRPATSGGSGAENSHQFRNNNASPLRGSGGTAHSASFSFGQSSGKKDTASPGGAGTSPPLRGGVASGGGESFLPVHRPHNHHPTNADHEGGPGKRGDGGYGGLAQSDSPVRPSTSHGGVGGGMGGGTAAPRSPSAVRYQQANNGTYALATPGYDNGAGSPGENNGNSVAFYDGGRQVPSNLGLRYQFRVSSAHQSGNKSSSPSSPGDVLRSSGEFGHRPGTSGGLRGSGSGSPGSGASPYLSGAGASQTFGGSSSGAYAGQVRVDHANHSYATQSADARPRTSGGTLATTSGQGRSQSHGRSGLYKRRF